MASPTSPPAPIAAPAAPGIAVQNLTLKCSGAPRPAVDAVDLGVPRGELLTLLGPSGCGKTTLLRLLAGLTRPDAGCIEIDGVDVTAQPAAERPLSLVFQNYALFSHLSVRDNVAFGLRASGVDEAQVRVRADEALHGLGLHALAARAPGELSGGQQQRVALARALALKPAVLLFDEPLSNLDAHLRRRTRDDIRALQQRLGLTVVIVTHDQAEAMAVSDRVAVMAQGRIVQCGTPRELYAQPATPFVGGFMGDMAEFVAPVGHDGMARLGPLRVDLPGAAGLSAARGSVRLAVRPQAWRIGPPSSRGLAARVLRSAFVGRCVEYTLASEIGEVFVVAWHAPHRHEDGAPVSLTLDAQGVAAFAAAPPCAALA